jgi:putative ABC transport system permease protein
MSIVICTADSEVSMVATTLDLRAALRRIFGAPALPAGIAAALALAIAGSTLVFSIVHAVLLKALPYRDPDRVVWVWATRTDRDKAFFSVADFLDYRAASRTLSPVAVGNWGVNLTGTADPQRLQGVRVTPNAFVELGVTAAVGRTLLPSDGDAPAHRVAVISHRLWRSRFAGRADAVGAQVRLNGGDYTVVGVLPADFVFPGFDPDVCALLFLETDPRRRDRDANFLRVFARLTPGATMAQARDEWGRIARELRAAYPETNAKKTEPRVIALADEMFGIHRPALSALMAGILGVWLLACANIVNLQIIRLVARERETAIRRALGASTPHLVLPEIVEQTAIALIGGLGGLAIACVSLPLIAAAVPATLPRAAAIRIDAASAAFALALIALSSAFVAAVPVLRHRRLDVERLLRANAPLAATPSKRRIRAVVAACEVAAALCLLIVTAFALKTYVTLAGTDPGVRLNGLLQTRISLPPRYANAAALERFLTLSQAGVGDVPGVSAVAAANALPLSAQNNRTDFTIASAPAASRTDVPGAQNRWVTAGYFETVGISLASGRTFSEDDATARAPVAVIDEALAAQFWRGRSPLGDRVRILDGTPEGRVLEIVGVVRNVAHFDLGEPPLGTLYGMVQQIPPANLGFFAASVTIAVRGEDGDAVRRGIVAALRKVDADVPVGAPSSMAEEVRRVLATRRFVAIVLGIFAAAALLLAVSGVYAVVSANAREQLRELAVRSALGASHAAMLGVILVPVVRVLSAGVPLGVLLAAAVVPATAGTALSIPRDWPLWVVSAALLSLVALLASYLKARRAVALDPVLVLRE